MVTKRRIPSLIPPDCVIWSWRASASLIRLHALALVRFNSGNELTAEKTTLCLIAMVNFSLSPEQRALRSSARDFASDVLSTAPRLYDHLATQTTRFRSTLPIYQSAISAGLIKGQVPVSCGGSSTSMLDAAIVVEELYAADPSTALTILGTGLGLTPLILAGNREQHERLLTPFTKQEGERLASFVHSEPGGTANWLRKGSPGLQTTAYKDGDEWVVNGEKVSYSLIFR